jgi:galactokinase
VYSENLRQARQWPVEHIAGLKASGDWTDYVIGIARQLSLGRGRDLLVHSTVPLGSGLSSSASLEVAVALALGWSGELPSLELVQLARRAENEFIGLPSGIMDQYAAVFGRHDAALKIDCRDLSCESVELPGGVAILAVNSMVKHEHASSGYRQRVEECAQAEREIQKSLRDATLDDLTFIHDVIALRRARHIITENQRVLDFIAASRRGDLAEMGRLLVASHRSLQTDYEVSCEELDFLVDAAMSVPGVIGARMTGGGFGGCTVNFVEPAAVDRFQETVSKVYRDRFGIGPVFYMVKPSEGASRVS